MPRLDFLVRAVDRVARRPALLFGLAVLMIASTGWLDHVTGASLSVGPLYAVPLFVGTWYLGFPRGAALALGSVAVGFLSDLTASGALSLSILVWNTAARTLIFMFIVAMVARMRDALLSRDRAWEREQETARHLKAADEMKDTFLNAASHELRTPVTAILGSVSTLDRLADTIGADERRALVAAVSRNAAKLDRLLRDLLDVDRVSRNPHALDRKNVDLENLAADCLRAMQLPGDRQVRLVTESVFAYVDPAKVERVLENLVSNAVKYSPPSATIWVMTTRHGSTPALVVEDAGSGVAPEYREAIFEPFRRLGATEGIPGVGIGLSLVREFARLHGGDAWVEERPGGGARFVVTLPEEGRRSLGADEERPRLALRLHPQEGDDQARSRAS
jgi:signal transduction histidine kinase